MRWRRLSPVELDAYDVLPPRLARRVRLLTVPALPGGYAGMTLGPLVLLVRDVPSDGSSALLAHELVHVRQWAELGFWRFTSRYLADFAVGLARHRRWRPAYLGIGLEVAARAEAGRWWRRTLAAGSAGDGGEALP